MPSDGKTRKVSKDMCPFATMKSMGIHMVFKSNIHQKFAIIDQRIVWYGSINLLGYGRSEETIMRIESAGIAHELLKSLE